MHFNVDTYLGGGNSYEDDIKILYHNKGLSKVNYI